MARNTYTPEEKKKINLYLDQLDQADEDFHNKEITEYEHDSIVDFLRSKIDDIMNDSVNRANSI